MKNEGLRVAGRNSKYLEDRQICIIHLTPTQWQWSMRSRSHSRLRLWRKFKSDHRHCRSSDHGQVWESREMRSVVVSDFISTTEYILSYLHHIAQSVHHTPTTSYPYSVHPSSSLQCADASESQPAKLSGYFFYEGAIV